MKSVAGLCSLLFLGANLIGCGGDSGPPPLAMFKVSGTVTLGGQPLEKGNVVFDPADSKGTPVQGAIENGKFEFEAPVGKKTVRISSVRETGEKDEYGSPISESIVPDKYNGTSELTADVTEAGPNSFEFKLDKE